MPLPSGDGPVSSLESKGASSKSSAGRQYRVCVPSLFSAVTKNIDVYFSSVKPVMGDHLLVMAKLTAYIRWPPISIRRSQEKSR